MAALIDTSGVVAALDRSDPAHARVVAALGAERGSILVPLVTLPEIGYLVEERHGPVRAAAVMTRLVHDDWPIIGLEPSDLERAADLMTRYADAAIGFVDAGVVALAERLGIRRVYTLDHRDFSLVRPRHVEAFDIAPP